jgi:hypothetical protein
MDFSQYGLLVSLTVIFYVLSLFDFEEDGTRTVKVELLCLSFLGSIVIMLNAFNLDGVQNYSFFAIGLLLWLISLLNLWVCFTVGSFEKLFGKLE